MSKYIRLYNCNILRAMETKPVGRIKKPTGKDKLGPWYGAKCEPETLQENLVKLTL
jgi:hypothetical protein